MGIASNMAGVDAPLLFSNLVQSEIRSAAPPYEPEMLLMHWTILKARWLGVMIIAPETKLPGLPPFAVTAHATMPTKVALTMIADG